MINQIINWSALFETMLSTSPRTLASVSSPLCASASKRAPHPRCNPPPAARGQLSTFRLPSGPGNPPVATFSMSGTPSIFDLPRKRFQSSSAAVLPRKERLRRSLLFVPGEERRLVAATKMQVKPDCVVYDLEDSVPPEKKVNARNLVFEALNSKELGKVEKTVRINSVGSGFEVEDLRVILQSPNVTTIHIPKVVTAQDVLLVDKLIVSFVGPEELGRRQREGKDIRIVCLIESAMAMLNLREICESSPRVDGLAFASVDYTADANLINQPDRREFMMARQWLVMHASAYTLQAIDMVCVDVKNDPYLEAECLEGRQWGYTGKAAIHPRQVDIINRAFAPSEKEVDLARRIVDGYKEFEKKGLGAFALDGKMIDEPVRKAAEKTLARAEAIATAS